MKTLQKLSCSLCLFLLISLSTMRATGADQNSAKEQLTGIEKSASAIIDNGLRKGTLEMVRLITSHDSSKPETRGEQVQEIYRASWLVYANFLGVRATYSDREVEKSRAIITQVYEIGLQQTSWVLEQKTISRELGLARADLKKKFEFFKSN